MHQISELSLFSGPANCSAWEATPSHNFQNVYCCNDTCLVIKLQPLVLMS